MSSKPKTVTTTGSKDSTSDTTSEKEEEKSEETGPWSGAAGYFDDYYKAAQDAYSKTKAFTGDYVASATDAQRQAIQMLLSVAPTLNQGAEPIRAMAQRIAGGEFLSADNPILQGGIAGAINPIKMQLQNEILPQITDAAIRGGAYGGTGNALQNTKVVDDYARASQDLSGRMTLDWFNQRFGDIFQTPGMFNAANQLDLAPSLATGLAGETERMLNQLALDNAVKKYENEQWANWYGVDKWGDALTKGGYNSSEGTSTSSGSSTTETEGSDTSETEESAPDMWTQILQGLLGAGATAASMYTAFSDRRLKTDITRIGQVPNGLPLYRFRFNGQPDYQIGFMADEVEAKIPEAVTIVNSFKVVDYIKAMA